MRTRRALTVLLLAAGSLAACTKQNTPSADGASSFLDGHGVDRAAHGDRGTDRGTRDGTTGPGQPITAPDKVWTWVPFPESRCADNSATGIGVNLSSQSTKVLIYLRGGGACWDYETCHKQPPIAVNLDGFGESDFKALNLDSTGIFDRAWNANPFKDWSLVFVPYCTGDLHGGTQHSSTTGMYHLGHKNISAYLKRIVPTFPKATQVLLTGSSAGGLGVVFNFHQVQTAFGSVPVDGLDDSGPMLDEAYLKPKLQTAFRSAWGLSSAFPPGCSACQTGYLDDLVVYLGATYTQRRLGLISAREDSVVRAYFGQGYTPPVASMPATEFKAGLDHFADTLVKPYPSWRVYYVNGVWHVFLTKTTLALTSVSGTKLLDWIEAMVQGSPTWTNVRPP